MPQKTPIKSDGVVKNVYLNKNNPLPTTVISVKPKNDVSGHQKSKPSNDSPIRLLEPNFENKKDRLMQNVSSPKQTRETRNVEKNIPGYGDDTTKEETFSKLDGDKTPVERTSVDKSDKTPPIAIKIIKNQSEVVSQDSGSQNDSRADEDFSDDRSLDGSRIYEINNYLSLFDNPPDQSQQSKNVKRLSRFGQAAQESGNYSVESKELSSYNALHLSPVERKSADSNSYMVSAATSSLNINGSNFSTNVNSTAMNGSFSK